jgi:hypothetical protein
MRPTNNAYTAGFFDADGSCRMVKGYARVTISQTDRRPLDQFVKWFGGGLTWTTNRRTGQGRWVWNVTGEFAEEFLKAVQPYVILKKGDVKGILNPSD